MIQISDNSMDEDYFQINETLKLIKEGGIQIDIDDK